MGPLCAVLDTFDAPLDCSSCHVSCLWILLGEFLVSRTSRGSSGAALSVFFQLQILAVLPILSAFSPLSLHASKTPRRVTRSANNPAAPRRVRPGGVRPPCMHALHACACALRMQFMLMHAVHGMKCQAFSMLCWGYPRRTSIKTSILSLLHSKTIDFTAPSAQNAVPGK